MPSATKTQAETRNPTTLALADGASAPTRELVTVTCAVAPRDTWSPAMITVAGMAVLAIALLAYLTRKALS